MINGMLYGFWKLNQSCRAYIEQLDKVVGLHDFKNYNNVYKENYSFMIMESNFIKERVVVREQLIKKNANSSKKDKSSTTLANALDTPPERVVAIEELVNEKLKQDLVEISKQVDSTCETIADYIKIRSALKVFKTNPNDVRVMTNIGCNFYAQCQIPDSSKIFLCIGKDYFLHMDLDEAINMINFLEKKWTTRLDKLQEKAASIKAYIKIALEAMGRLYEVDREKLSK